MAFSARPPISKVATDVPGYKDGYYDGSDRPNRESYYVTSEASPEPGDEWTRPDLTDEQLAELNPRTRSSIEHSRRVEANKGGRPAIGPRVHVALPPSLLAFIDDYAASTREDVKEETTRAEAIRSLLELARQVIEGQPVDVAEWVANGGLSECHPDDFDRE